MLCSRRVQIVALPSGLVSASLLSSDRAHHYFLSQAHPRPSGVPRALPGPGRLRVLHALRGGGRGRGESENLCLGLANCREFSPLSCAECYSGEDACEGMAYSSVYVLKKNQRNGLVFFKGCFVFHIEFAISLHNETAFPEQDMHKNQKD